MNKIVSTDINISLNGEPYSIAESATLTDLVETLELQNSRYAIEVNLDIIPRSEHAQFKLTEGDQVEVVQAIGGG